MNARAWILFLAVSVLWGIPYLLIKVAVEDLSPAVIVFARTGAGMILAATGCYAYAGMQVRLRHACPRRGPSGCSRASP